MSRLFIFLLFVLGLGDSFSSELYFTQVKVISPEPPHHFKRIYTHIRQNIEGNYVNIRADKGKETYGGISRVAHPNWYGWKYIDAAKPLKRHQVVKAAEHWVLDFYLNLWVREGFETIEDYQVALNLFDFRIHSSPKTVTKKVNRVLEELGCDPIVVRENWVDERFNRVEPSEFILRLKIQRLILFNYLVRNDKSQITFYEGWVKRLRDI